MIFASLSLEDFRCFSTYQANLHPRFNYIVGKNGSGKTAFLEAMSVICTARSFRVREVDPLIRSDRNQFILHARFDPLHTIGIQKSKDTQTILQINGQACYRTSELVSLLPSQVIYQDIFQIIDAGPIIRRQLLDWGVFHVKPSYHERLRQYRQGIKQRNVLLKKNGHEREFVFWDQTLSGLANQIDEARRGYVEALNPLFTENLKKLSHLTCQLSYYNGWRREHETKDLAMVLKENLYADKMRQYTQYGPHHADIEIESTTGKIKKFFSRGQQKMVLLALKLAQAQLLNKPCIYLWDDIGSELDLMHQQKLGELLQEIPGQYFITGIQADQSPIFRKNPGVTLVL